LLILVNLVQQAWGVVAHVADPLAIFAEQSEAMSLQAVRQAILARLRPAVDALAKQASGDTDGRAWEWVAPVVIDAISGACACTPAPVRAGV
jgi:hypothetical protein